jgi:AcrR family transcriptional regulator
MELNSEIGSSHDRILRAAKHLFASRGYEKTSTIMIVREAGTSESQLAKHFGTKAGLLEAVLERGWQAIEDLLVVVDSCAEPAQKLRLLFEQVVAGLQRDPELKQILLLDSRRRRRGGAGLLTCGLQLTRRVEQALEEMQRRGQLCPGLPPEALRSALIGMCEGMLRDQMLGPCPGSSSDNTDPTMRRVIDATLCAWSASPAAARTADGSALGKSA